MMIRFDIYHDGERWCARAIDADIFTQGDTLEELLRNLREAVLLYTDGKPAEILIMSSMEVKASDAEVASC